MRRYCEPKHKEFRCAFGFFYPLRHVKVAEFIYILNGYNGYIWDFQYYLVEWYRREQERELWEMYIAKCVSAGIDKNVLPDYAVLLKRIKNYDTKTENPEAVKARIIEKVNKANTK